MWDGLDAEALARRLRVPLVDLHAELESTQDTAHALAEQGATAGTIVLADAQRAGRGRMGRSWRSDAGQGVWCTIVERPGDAQALDVLSLRVGLLLAERLDAFANGTVRVKWPNDLLVEAGKLAGILLEVRWSGATPLWAAIGVGVNVVPPAVQDAAGLNAGTRRIDVLAAVVAAVRDASQRSGWLTDDELRRYNARDVLHGRRVRTPGAGTVKGVASSGALIVEGAGGIEQHRAGTVEFAEEL